jgi:hypothetical protein
VENFSYVFQTSGSDSKSISREQMRSFKKVWAEYSNPKTGYLERPRFAAFFSVSYSSRANLCHILEHLGSNRNLAEFLKSASILWNLAFATLFLLAKWMTLSQRSRTLT